MVLRNILATLGILAIVTVSVVAIDAQRDRFDDSDAPPRISVSFRGLDLRTWQGVDALNGRVRGAVNQICEHGAFTLSARRLERNCRDLAFASAEPQIARAIAQARGTAPYPAAAAERTVFDDLDTQPGEIRRSITRAVERSLASGVTANWYASRAHGLVFVRNRYIDDRGRSCGLVTVTSRSHGRQDVLAAGGACVLPDVLPYY